MIKQRNPAASPESRILDAPIRTWSPNHEGGEHIAMIGSLHFVFRGKSPLQAHRRAEEWRQREYEKLTSERLREADRKARGVEK